MTERFFDLVVPLAQGDLFAPGATAMRSTDTTAHHTPPVADRSGAVAQLALFPGRPADVDSTNHHSTPATPTTPGTRTSAMATRTTTTRTTAVASCSSADQAPPPAPAGPSFPQLAEAYFDCRRTKRNSPSALAFEADLERNLSQLHDELTDGRYQPGPSICFVITRPKPREVWAADFRDRIVHHLFYNQVGPAIEARFIADSCACIPGRGTLYAARRLEAKIRSHTDNWQRPGYYLKADLANFFVSIDKRILGPLLARHIDSPWWRNLGLAILHHDPRANYTYRGRPDLLDRVPPHKRLTHQPAHLGLPIGNLSSQFFANVLLNELDQFVKHQIGARHYIRYVDDFVLLHDSPRWLNAALADIDRFLRQRLALRLNPAKTILQPIDRGIDFVGQLIKPWRRTTRQRTRNAALHRIAHLPANALQETANSYFGLFRQASHGHRDRTRLANLLRRRGHTIAGDLTKTYRHPQETPA